MSTNDTSERRQWRGLSIPPINPRFGMAVLPVLVFWLLRQVASPEVAIGAGFITSLIVFFTNRKRGVTGKLAVLAIIIIGGGATVGIVTGNEKAFLFNDPIGDFTIMAIALGSIIFRRPLFALLARELVPAVERFLEPRHSVFFLSTWLLILVNAARGTSRIFLLQNLTVNQYLIWSRVISWPLNITLLIVTYMLINHAVKRSTRFQEMLSEDEASSGGERR